jgi:hypothetical protein
MGRSAARTRRGELRGELARRSGDRAHPRRIVMCTQVGLDPHLAIRLQQFCGASVEIGDIGNALEDGLTETPALAWTHDPRVRGKRLLRDETRQSRQRGAAASRKRDVERGMAMRVHTTGTSVDENEPLFVEREQRRGWIRHEGTLARNRQIATKLRECSARLRFRGRARLEFAPHFARERAEAIGVDRCHDATRDAEEFCKRRSDRALLPVQRGHGDFAASEGQRRRHGLEVRSTKAR